MPAVIKLAIADDQQLFRAGLKSLLKDHPEFTVVLEASDGEDLIKKLKRTKPHILLLDVEMPVMNGIEAIENVKRMFPDVRIVIVTMHDNQELIFELMSRGANGYIPKSRTVEELVDALYAVMETGKYYNAQIAEAMVNGLKNNNKTVLLSDLEPIEKEIIKLICAQKTNREIAEILHLKPRTLEGYRAAILEKTGTRNSAGLAIFAMKNKLVGSVGFAGESN